MSNKIDALEKERDRLKVELKSVYFELDAERAKLNEKKRIAKQLEYEKTPQFISEQRLLGVVSKFDLNLISTSYFRLDDDVDMNIFLPIVELSSREIACVYYIKSIKSLKMNRFQKATQRKLAKDLIGCSDGRVGQILASAIRKINHPIHMRKYNRKIEESE